MTASEAVAATSGERAWLFELATPQRGGGDQVAGAYYDDVQQMTCLKSTATPIIESVHGPKTKKADREVGEDQKG